MTARFSSLITTILILFSTPATWAQPQTPLGIARRYLAAQRENWQLTEADISDLRVTDQYRTKHNGLTHIYLIQQHAGIELFNAISGLHITEEGSVAFATNRFTPNLASRVNATQPLFTAYDAIESAAAHLGLPLPDGLRLKEQKGGSFFIYSGGNISDSDIGARLVYQLMPDGAARLAWCLAIDQPAGANYWNLRVDALAGTVLSKDNWTAHCVFPGEEAQCAGEEPDLRVGRGESGTQHLSRTQFGRRRDRRAESPSKPGGTVHAGVSHAEAQRRRACSELDSEALIFNMRSMLKILLTYFFEQSQPGTHLYAPPHFLTPSTSPLLPFSTPPLLNSAQYHVFPIPLENPADGSRELLLNPHDPLASPYGWHDTDGQEGPEHQITRGNNVHAYQDSDGNNSSSGDEPDGGPGLIFDFPLDLSQEPETYQDASVVQLFYANNFMHDLAYAYGFDEAAGNFQHNNYGRGGVAGDYVAAEAQDGSDINNANFTTIPDGGIGRMQMFRWNSPGAVFSVTAPEPVAGSYEVRPALFGGSISSALLAGALVEYDDGSAQPALACSPAQNAAELNGNVALIDRGACDFDRKALYAQNAGAVAAIICNYADDLVNMGPVSVGNQVGIPVVSMRYSNCQTLRQFLSQGVEVAFQLPDDNGPMRLDGSLDNAVVAHEYTHGITNRLVGGPASTSCLSNDEQMGEGWSDFLSLAVTAKPGDTGATPRTYASYLLRQGAGGTGLRRQPYSTDMALNNQTYEDIIGTAIYQDLGEVWAVMLWDLYWKLAEVYGWDEDPVHGSGGNNLAMQLVMDALKLQACDPGFTDGRDALLAADAMNNGGANACYIWEVFARRGLGYSANQGSRFSRNDGLAAFDMLPECLKELKISKSVSPLADAGEEFVVTLAITNHKETTATGVMVNDEIPSGTVFAAGSASGASFEATAGEIVFNLGDLAPGEERLLSYRLSTDPGSPSIRQFLDDMESGGDNWISESLNPAGLDRWAYSDNDANSGDYSWYARNTANANDQALQLKDPIAVSGTRPALRFYHRYETEAGLDGGFVEVSTDGGASWIAVQEQVTRAPYPRPLAAGTLGIPGLRAYSGSSGGGWLDTYVDLGPFLGEELLVRFRFGSNDSGAPNAFNPGWYVDDVEFLDMVNYNGEACVSSLQGDQACARAPFLGTVVESAVASGAVAREQRVAVDLFPNPARDVLNIMLQSERPTRISVSLSGMEGRLIREHQMDIMGGYQLLPLDISGLVPGFYVLRVSAGNMAWAGKVVVRE